MNLGIPSKVRSTVGMQDKHPDHEAIANLLVTAEDQLKSLLRRLIELSASPQTIESVAIAMSQISRVQNTGEAKMRGERLQPSVLKHLSEIAARE